MLVTCAEGYPLKGQITIKKKIKNQQAYAFLPFFFSTLCQPSELGEGVTAS